MAFFLKLIADFNRYILEEIARIQRVDKISIDDEYQATLERLKDKSLEHSKFFYELARKSA